MDLSIAALLASLAFNVVLPAIWLTTLSKQVDWPPLLELCLGLAAPLGFGLVQGLRRRRFSPLSAISMISILLTAAVGFFAATRFWFAVKGATLPLLISIAIVSQRQRLTLLLEDIIAKGAFLNTKALLPKLADHQTRTHLHRILGRTTDWLALHFLFNGALNGTWNWILVTADPGTAAFNEQYGVLLARNLYLVALPSAVSIILIVTITAHRVRMLSGLSWKDLLAEPTAAPAIGPQTMGISAPSAGAAPADE